MEHTNVEKQAIRRNGKLLAKLVEKTPWNKLCVDLIVHKKISSIGKYALILKAVTMIEPVTRWFEITKYSNNKVMMIENLV